MSPRIRPRRFGAVVLGVVAALVAVRTTEAQLYQTVSEGLSAGHFLVYPSIVFEYTRDSNIFYSTSDLPDEVTSTGVVVVRPRIMVDLPLSDSRIRWVYAPFYRDYTSQNFTGSNRLNHAFDLEGRFRTHGAVTLSVRDHFLRGTVSLLDQNSGNGLSFGLGRYSAHNPTLEIGLNLGARHGVSLIPSYSRTSFLGIDEALRFRYTTRRLEGRYNYKLGEAETFYGYYAYEGSSQKQPSVEDVRFFSREAGFGLTRYVNQTVVTQVSAGYQTMDFENGGGRNFSGPVLDGAASWLLSEGMRLEFGILRHPYATIYAGSDYFIDGESRLRLTMQLGAASYLNVGVTGLRNVYAPDQGTRRRDTLFRFEAGLGHQFLRTLRGYIGASTEGRRSNVEEVIGGEDVDPFHYRVNRLLFRLEAGWM